jgi:hypothetical protein
MPTWLIFQVTGSNPASATRKYRSENAGNLPHLRRVPAEYEDHYNRRRPHRTLLQASPLRGLPEPANLDHLSVQRRDRLGGIVSRVKLGGSKWSGRICSCCLWTRCAAGGATTTCSPTCSAYLAGVRGDAEGTAAFASRALRISARASSCWNPSPAGIWWGPDGCAAGSQRPSTASLLASPSPP